MKIGIEQAVVERVDQLIAAINANTAAITASTAATVEANRIADAKSNRPRG